MVIAKAHGSRHPYAARRERASYFYFTLAEVAQHNSAEDCWLDCRARQGDNVTTIPCHGALGQEAQQWQAAL